MSETESDSQDPDQPDSVRDGDPPRVHRPRRALPTDVVRPTRAEVQLSALRHNLGQLRKVAGATPIWAVLKADAYGHGAKAVARTLERAGVDGVCVALVEEGVELREAGIRLPILVMGGYYGNAFHELTHHGLTPVLSDVDQVESLARAVKYSDDSSFACHVKVDTGMARLGARPEDWHELAQRLSKTPQLEVHGLMTHLANADVAREGVFQRPLELFAEARTLLAEHGVEPSVLHMANSGAVLRDARTHFDLVRPGVALFGVDPLAHLPSSLQPERDPIRLKPTMTVISKIVSLRTLQKGDSVGYGGSFVAPGKREIATVPMGYADGLSRSLSDRGSVLVRGKRAPIVGSVSMDMTMIDVTDIEGAQNNDSVVFLGSQKGPHGEDTITATEVAEWSGTIPWEILTNISRRVPRFYREA